jgi:hypothetical protein
MKERKKRKHTKENNLNGIFVLIRYCIAFRKAIMNRCMILQKYLSFFISFFLFSSSF